MSRRARAASSMLALALGCTTGATGTTGAEIPAASAQQALAVARPAVEPELIEARFGRRLWAEPWDLPEGGTDSLPPRAFWIESHGRRRPAPDAIDGTLTASGAVFVTVEHELVDETGHVIAASVEGSVCASPEGDHVAFTQENGRGLSMVSIYALGSDRPPRPATETLDDALMPFYLRDGSLLLTGAHHGERLGLYRIDASGEPHRLTNVGLHPGEGDDDGRFVPVPLGPRHMRELDDGRVAYLDGDGEQTVDVSLPPRDAAEQP